ncbi:MAG TPA: 2TM domain-containing protein [Nitriliruptorales bacterium]
MTSSDDAFERVVARERSYARGKRFRHARRALLVHAYSFAIVNAILVASWIGELILTDGEHPAWWVPTTLGWGVGLVVHAALVYRPWRRHTGGAAT